MIPYERIIENGNRAWTTRLIDRLASDQCSDDELTDLVVSLIRLSDPRSELALRELILDVDQSPSIREAASSALTRLDWGNDPNPSDIERWWKTGDLITRRHALRCMGLCGREIIVQVASDPVQPLQVDALLRMEFFFDEPKYQAIKIAALRHRSPMIRRTAAKVLLWDEPILAEMSLWELTFDNDSDSVIAACETLKYYPTQRVIRRLADLRTNGDSGIAEVAEITLRELRLQFTDVLRSANLDAQRYLQQWCRPIWEILDLTKDEFAQGVDVDASAYSLAKEKTVMKFDDLVDVLSNPDYPPQSLQTLLSAIDWSHYGSKQHAILRRHFLSHADVIVRDASAEAFRVWGDTQGLLELTEDTTFLVRKSAMYELGHVSKNYAIADFAWNHLQDASTLGIHAGETLATYVYHADQEEAVTRLQSLLTDCSQREEIRCTALQHLRNLGALNQIPRLPELLADEPAVTWAFHIQLLDSLDQAGIYFPEMGWLREVDHLDVQAGIAQAISTNADKS